MSPGNLPRLVVLDRDGVINEDRPDHVRCEADWIPLPGSLAAIARLSRAGVKVVVATNQSGIGRGLYDIATLHRVHQKMLRMAVEAGGNIDAIFFCPHTPDDGCRCRKPAPGLLEDIAERYRIELDGVPVIGDARRDLEAAVAVRARPILVRTGKGSDMAGQLEGMDGVTVHSDLSAAVDALLPPLE